MSKFLVYLAGPITGLTFDGAEDWRKEAIAALGKHGITGLSPLRAKEYLREIGKISGTGEEYAHMGVLSTPRGVTTRDRYDATRCDVLFVNVLGAKSVSIGTVMEIAWADSKRIPIVMLTNEGNPHEHMMINECIGFKCYSFEDAIHVIKAIAGVGHA